MFYKLLRAAGLISLVPRFKTVVVAVLACAGISVGFQENVSLNQAAAAEGLEQIYLTVATGISGTPMPAFGAALDPNQIWSIVYYLESLVPADRRIRPGQLLGEEQQGCMALHMGGRMGPGRAGMRR